MLTISLQYMRCPKGSIFCYCPSFISHWVADRGKQKIADKATIGTRASQPTFTRAVQGSATLCNAVQGLVQLIQKVVLDLPLSSEQDSKTVCSLAEVEVQGYVGQCTGAPNRQRAPLPLPRPSLLHFYNPLHFYAPQMKYKECITGCGCLTGRAHLTVGAPLQRGVPGSTPTSFRCHIYILEPSGRSKIWRCNCTGEGQ